MGDAKPTARDRIMDAAITCADEFGIGGFSLEVCAERAGVSRATIYRHFSGGREQLVTEAVTREVGRFWAELADEVRDITQLESRLVVGIMAAHQRLDGHDLLQRLLVSESEELVPALLASQPLVHQIITDYMVRLLAGEELTSGVEVGEAADYLTRMLLMHIQASGRWDMTDESQIRRLVRTQFLAGIVPST